jgi:ABC-2 type transport system ATP-binding protein
VEALCSRVGIVRDGRLVEISRIETLRQNRVKRITAVFRGEPPNLSSWRGVEDLTTEQNRVQFSYHGSVQSLLGLLSSGQVDDITVNDPSLEEVFRAYYRSPEERKVRAA